MTVKGRTPLEYATLGTVSSNEEYSRRLRARESALTRFDRWHARIGSARLAIGALFLIMAWFCFGRFALATAWLLVPVAAFAGLVLYHQRVRAQRVRAQRAGRS